MNKNTDLSQTRKQRIDGRLSNQLRQVTITQDIYDFAPGSLLFQMGKTKILCAVSMQNGVPAFLRGKGAAWLTAEYALLPASTITRTQRESSLGRKDGRSVEIARFIGRCFRSVVDLSALGERTIVIDCDVLQADGGTRVASITGAFLALLTAQKKWLAGGIITRAFIKEHIAAVSVGYVNDQVVLDLNYDEDSNAGADFNFVITHSDKIIEMQGGAEKAPLSWDLFDQIRAIARDGAQQIFALYAQEGFINNTAVAGNVKKDQRAEVEERVPLFSLKNRQQSL
jgi:ribonuclease PH